MQLKEGNIEVASASGFHHILDYMNENTFGKLQWTENSREGAVHSMEHQFTFSSYFFFLLLEGK